MFGRQKKQPDGGGGRVQVDATLERDVARIEQSVAGYLKNPTDTARSSLLAALEALDEQTDQSDAYEGSIIGSGAVGYASKGEVVGETSIDSVVDEISDAGLQAQVAFVRMAKNEARQPTTESFAALQAAQAALAATRDQIPRDQ
jgi:hypothetical protein